ncbi:hypothetical protein NDU88_005158 [Pleurodeles waltl]|uniref:Reverse transcriptase domain-containing protein n=1 Tax=Pleurodeles waltl TaxID=8319 RepID=A0AAV7WA97_PLEWA|nr:hypothetical protein NDU88_005158 [Pleurodeles waltl]
MDHGSMAQTFANDYRDLFRAERGGLRPELPHFGQDLPVTGLSAEDRASLEANIMVEELTVALAHLNPRKTPGPNGFPPEYWHLVWQQAGQTMLEIIQEALEMGKLPRDLQNADIVVPPKPGTAGQVFEDFQPISLPYTEVKVWVMVLANRLGKIIEHLVHPDQSGFMLARATRHNLRQVHNAIALSESVGERRALLSIDFQKAFDSVDWANMFALLEQIGCGPRFLRSCTPSQS